jgi:hypothetical protein
VRRQGAPGRNRAGNLQGLQISRPENARWTTMAKLADDMEWLDKADKKAQSESLQLSICHCIIGQTYTWLV